MTRMRSLLVLILVILLLAMLAATWLPAGIDRARVMAAGRPMLFALLKRAEIGDLVLGPATPPIYALARRSDEGSRSGAAVAARLRVAEALRQAAARLGRAGDSDRLAGIVLGSQGDYRQAEAALRQGELAHSNDPFVRLAAGNVLDELGQRDAALDHWQEIDVARAISFQLYREGVRRAQAGQRALAEQMLLLATEIDPSYADPYHALGGFYWGQDDQKAAEMYQAALEVGGLEPFFEWMARGKLALLEDRPEDAITALQEAVRLRPDHGNANQFLGVALRRVGRNEEAIPYLAEAARLSPNSPWPLIQLAQAYLDEERFDQAVQTLSHAIEIRADLPVAFDLLAQAHLAMGQPEQAATAWQQAIALRPDNAVYYARLGDAWQFAGEVEEAVAAYRQALSLEPGNAYVQRQLERLGASAEGEP